MDEELEYEWEGYLPPDGTECEAYILADTADQGRPMNRWISGVFVGRARSANGGVGGVFKDIEDVSHFIEAFGYFRPRRTEEQIAADERAFAITAMKKVFDSCSDELMPTSQAYLETLFGAIHDAGWKQVQP